MTSVAAARAAQRRWEPVSLRRRLAVAAHLRAMIAEHAAELARLAAAPNDRPVAEKMVSEVIPLLDACRFLEREAPRILHARKFGKRRRPFWLRGSSFTVERRPFGVILIVGPRNYPLFLPAVQMLQAMVAGNAVLLKPAENCSAPVRWLAEQLFAADLVERDLLQLLPEPPASAQQAVRAGVEKVIFTGSSENGRRLLALMAERNTPGVFELSGADCVFVRQDADLERAARAIAFGRRLNAGETCMAPQIILAHSAVAARLTECLRALDFRELEVRTFADDRAALDLSRQMEFGLGAAIFSADESAAHAFARQLPTGFVTINDLIVPTADPRFPFGGVRASGFGTTRGAEGLLEMTYPHVIATRRARWLPHLDETPAGSEDIFEAYVKTAYGTGVGRRLKALGQLLGAAKKARRLK
ncbi:MAG: aldehyde dehydrogenase family protein [Spartobacteria bacterium]